MTIRKSNRKLLKELEAIVEKNTDKDFGTTDYDGLAEGVLKLLSKWEKKEK